MALRHNPVPFIFNKGDDATKLSCLEFFDLLHLQIAKDFFNGIKSRQLATGAYLSEINTGQWGMKETIRNTLLLLQTGMLREGDDLKRSIEFILSHQNPDGGWSENPLIKIPKHMVELNNERSVTWLTADAVEILRLAGISGRKPFRKALDWLKKMQNEHGGWHCYTGSIGEQKGTSGDPDSTAQITFLIGEIFGENDPVFLNGRGLIEVFLDELARNAERGYWIRQRDGKKEPLDVYSLTNLFLSSIVDQPRRILNGYDISDPRVQKVMDALIDIQQPDGGWRPFWLQESSPIYTMLAIKVLVYSRRLRIEDLIVDLRAYIGWQNLYRKLCGDADYS